MILKKYLISFVLVLAQLLWGGLGVAFAQDVRAAEPIPPVSEDVLFQPTQVEQGGTSEEISAEIAEVPVEIVSSDPQETGETPPLQETFNEQESLPPVDLATTTEVVIATTTEQVVDPLPDVVPPVDEEQNQENPLQDEPIVEELPPPVPEEEPVQPEVLNEPQAPEEQTILAPEQIEIALEELEPEPEFVLSVNTGKKVPAKRVVRQQVLERGKLVLREAVETITTEPQLSVDAKGQMNISGSCNQAYYVVMVYRNATDYDRDRASAIVNRAYECEGGTFTYTLDRLPSTLPNGTYFILIGEQGEQGTWTPSSALMEVTINRNPNL